MMISQQNPARLVSLHSGRHVPASLARSTFLALKTLQRSHPRTLQHALKAAADPEHYQVPRDGATRPVLRAHGLLTRECPDGTVRMHPLIKHIVASADAGDGRLRNPVKET